MKTVEVFTDGGCRGNPGPGGWGAVLRFGGHERELRGSEENTTNNRMELLAAISALEAMTEPCAVVLTTDSTYVKDGITRWIRNWKANGWKTAAKKPVKNKDLWEKLDKLCEANSVSWKWVKGHSTNEFNNLADKLATKAIK